MQDPMLSPVELGKKLKELREAAGLHQWHVGDEFGISKQAVSEWENGKSVPDGRKLVRLDVMYGDRGDVLALFGFSVSWREEAVRLQEQIDVLRTQVLTQAGQLEKLAASRRRSKAASAQQVDQSQ